MTDQRTAPPAYHHPVAPKPLPGEVTAPAIAPTYAPDEQGTEQALAAHRPDLLAAYRAARAGARAAVLGRLWGGLAREPIDGLRGRQRDGTDLVVQLTNGQRLRGPAAASEPFATVERVATVEPSGTVERVGGQGGPLTLTLDGVEFDHPARLVEALALPGNRSRFAAELDNSVANLALARAAARQASTPAEPQPADPPPAALGRADPLADAEQSIVDGHPLHPGCRTRTGMSTMEVLGYAPEHRPLVELTLVEVPPKRWLATGAPRPPLLPVHPWQLPRALAAGLRPVGPPLPARPLLSLRTLAPVHAAGYHIKAAIDVQLTTAVRIVSPAAVHNGPRVSALLVELARRTTDFAVLRELSAAAVLVDGEPSPSLAAVWRQAPRLGPGQYALPYAGLAGRPELVRAHFDRLVSLLLRPALALLHVGVALEAHGQNALVVFDADRPVRLLYRDLGGIRISPRRLAHAGLQAPPLRGDLVDDDPAGLRAKLFAAALSTVLGELVAVLVRTDGADPQRLWDRVAVAVRAAYRELPGDARADAVALTTEPWPIKAMTAMRLADRPLDDVWAYLPNPLVGCR